MYKHKLFCGTKPKCEHPNIMRPPLDAGYLPTLCSRWFYFTALTLILLTWRIWWAPNNASEWQMGFNSAFKGLSQLQNMNEGFLLAMPICQVWF